MLQSQTPNLTDDFRSFAYNILIFSAVFYFVCMSIAFLVRRWQNQIEKNPARYQASKIPLHIEEMNKVMETFVRYFVFVFFLNIL